MNHQEWATETFEKEHPSGNAARINTKHRAHINGQEVVVEWDRFDIALPPLRSDLYRVMVNSRITIEFCVWGDERAKKVFETINDRSNHRQVF